jgi:plastocyanin
MRAILRGPVTIAVATLLVAACSSPAVTSAPTTAATNPAATSPATTPAVTAGPTAAAAPCENTTDATTVEASIESFTFVPANVSAGVGDVITWTNGDSAPHAVGLDDGSCAMDGNILSGQSKSLVFTVAGTFPFHCTVHPSMTGTITIS